MPTSFVQIDQAGLPAGTPGESRSDGLDTGATVTVSCIVAPVGFSICFLDVPKGSVVPTISGSGPYTFSPPPGVYGTWRIECINNGQREVRTFAVRTPNKNLRIPAFNERADGDASLKKMGPDEIFYSEDNEGASYKGWHPDLCDLIWCVDQLFAGGGPGDHGALGGLLDDDHPQYLLVDGSRALTGDLDVGGNDITNVGLVDGVDVSNHRDRHESGGLDPIRIEKLTVFGSPAVGDVLTFNGAGDLVWTTPSTSGGATDHGALTGLLDDDHPQYLLIDGSRPMTGSLNMGGWNITSVNLVDGVDVSNHNTRHYAAGADPLDVGLLASSAASGLVLTSNGSGGVTWSSLPSSLTDHGSLTGLLDDDHPQYLLVDGSRPMAGSLNMGGWNITSVNLVDGVDVSSHRDRHERFSGLDPIRIEKLTVSGTPSAGDVLTFNSSGTDLIWTTPSTGGGVTDHGALTGLGDDDHLQYLLVNGSRPMTGSLNMGGWNITSVNLVDGVDVSNHRDRHERFGAVDPIRIEKLTVSGSPAAGDVLTFNSGTTDLVWTTPSTGGGATDHGALTGLLDDDHPQYLLIDGSRPMTGSLSVGGWNITNVNLVDGVDVSNHADRHEASGADPIEIEKILASTGGVPSGYVLSYGSSGLHTWRGLEQIGIVGSPGAGQVLTWNGSSLVWTTPAGGGGGVTDHGALTGLADDDHPQYLLVDGSRPMTGSLNMGGWNITSVNLVDGVDVSNHAASSHEFGGSDVLEIEKIWASTGGVQPTQVLGMNTVGFHNWLSLEGIHVSGSPGAGQVLTWNGASLVWTTPSTGGGLTPHSTTHQRGGSDEVYIEKLDTLAPTAATSRALIYTGSGTDHGWVGLDALLTHSFGSTIPSPGQVLTVAAGGNYASWQTPSGGTGLHAPTHIRGGSDEIDGDLLDIDYIPGGGYISDTSGTPGTSTEHLSSHLEGISEALRIRPLFTWRFEELPGNATEPEQFWGDGAYNVCRNLQITKGFLVQGKKDTSAGANFTVNIKRGTTTIGTVSGMTDTSNECTVFPLTISAGNLSQGDCIWLEVSDNGATDPVKWTLSLHGRNLP